MKKIFGDRNFQFWHYRVSHGELLIRSPKDANNLKNIDIMFFDVKYVEIPRFLKNIEIGVTREEDVIYIKDKIDKAVEHKDITVILSNGYRYFIVSSLMKISENQLDLFELPFM